MKRTSPNRRRSHKTAFARQAKQRARRHATLLCVGTAVRDRDVTANHVELLPDFVVVHQDTAQHRLRYTGTPIAWGDKRSLAEPYQRVSGNVVSGGGGVNSAVHAGRIISGRQLPICPVLVDLAAPSTELRAALESAKVRFVSPYIGHASVNFVITQRGLLDQRIVLKSPKAENPPPEPDVDWLRHRLRSENGTRALSKQDVVLINSAKSVALTRTASDLALQCGAVQISVLTGALPLEETLDLQVTRDAVSHGNLSEFAGLFCLCGVGCPSDERSAPLGDVAASVCEFAKKQKTGDLVVTFGPRGAMVFERKLAEVWHVELKPTFAGLVRDWMEKEPPVINGNGDRFTGAFALAYQLSSPQNSRSLDAVIRASMDVVRHLAPRLQPTTSWFHVRSVPVPSRMRGIGCLA